MKTDAEIQKDVIDELKWEPFLNASEIGVAVKNGVVTLSGMLDSYSKKISAEKAVKRVAGVKAIAEDIQIGISPTYSKTDTEIAEAVLNALKWHTPVKEEKIKIKVEDGIVRLDGEVDWEYQKVNAKLAIEHLAGVRGINNFITVTPRAAVADINKKIMSAFHRNATIDANRITAEVQGSKVILRGKVRSLAEKEDAEFAAWNAPGVSVLENKLVVEEHELSYAE